MTNCRVLLINDLTFFDDPNYGSCMGRSLWILKNVAKAEVKMKE
jgi:hypothetical protein